MNNQKRLYVGAIVAVLAVGVAIGAARLRAQPPTQPIVTPVRPGAPEPSRPIASPADPAAKIPFAAAPHGPVARVNRRTPGGRVIEYFRFTSRTDRTYVVEVPVSMTRDPRSRDEWIVLFSVYGRDPRADADTRAIAGTAMVAAVSDKYAIWLGIKVAQQAMRVQNLKTLVTSRIQPMNLWAAIHSEAKSSGDILKARAAWSHIATSKVEIKRNLVKLAAAKIALGNLYKESQLYEPARQQFREVADFKIFPYSAEAISKLRVMEGATTSFLQFQNPSLLGVERMSLSQTYQAAVRAQSTTP